MVFCQAINDRIGKESIGKSQTVRLKRLKLMFIIAINENRKNWKRAYSVKNVVTVVD